MLTDMQQYASNTSAKMHNLLGGMVEVIKRLNWITGGEGVKVVPI